MAPSDDPSPTTSLHPSAGTAPRQGETTVLRDGDSGASTQRRIEERVRQRLFTAEPGRTFIGRFLVLEPLGRGGMGMVHAAYDEQLDRKVAIKVLLDDELPTDDERLRFLREAQALARLSHPNVVAVHEVGDRDGRLFVAMEYVRGQSFTKWLRTEPEWREVLEAFVQAGRGLAAAHEAGVVHRDLKPGNLMRGDDGTVKVLDFGLARVMVDEASETWELASVSASYSTLDSPLTQAGTVLGTPAYMAPEQFGDSLVDARCDQYSFCVALWEGLVGRRPFDSGSLDSMLEARLAGPPAWPDSASAVPRRIVEAIRRGLSPEPSDRWPSMDALLRALSWDPRRRRNRWLVGGVGVIAVGLGVAATKASIETRAERCSRARHQLVGIWDEDRRREVGSSLLGVGPSYAGDVWAWTRRELDEYAEAWVDMHTEACEATSVSGEQSPRVLDLRMACLQRQASDLRAAVDTLLSADATVLSNAHELVTGLPPVSRCADVPALDSGVQPPLSRDVPAVEAARRALARARSERAAGRYPAAREAVDEATEALSSAAYDPVLVELALERGDVLDELGEYEAAERAFSEALGRASGAGLRGSMVEAGGKLMRVVGYRQRRGAEAMLLAPLLQGSSDEDPVRHAASRSYVADVLKELGKYAEAEAEHRAALARLAKALGPEALEVAGSRINLAIVLRRQGKYEEAEAEVRSALALLTRLLGPEHPKVASARGSLANVLEKRGKYEEAEAEVRTALAGLTQALGAEHAQTLRLRNNLAVMLNERGRYEEAEAEHRALLALKRESLGAEHPDIAMARNNLASTLDKRGKYEEAEAEHRAALALQERTLGSDHIDLATTRSGLAGVLGARGRHAEAEAEYRAALALQRVALGLGHPSVAVTQHNLASVLQPQGKYEDAVAATRAAMAVWEATLGLDHPHVTSSRTNLAILLHMQGQDEQAEVEARNAIAVRRRILGPEHPDVAESRLGLALALQGQGKLEEAETEVRAALESWVESLGPEHPTVAFARSDLGDLLRVRGQAEEAEAELRAALDVRVAALGDDHPLVAKSQADLARVLLERGRPAEALPLAEAAWARAQQDGISAQSRARYGFVLAQVSWSIDGPARDRARSRTLARDALDSYRAAGALHEDDALEVERWLDSR